MSSWTIITISGLAALAFSVCDTMAAHWARTGSKLSLAAVLTFASAGYLIFGHLSTKVNLGVAGGLVNALIVVFTALAGVIIFGEQTFTLKMLSGLGFIVVGVLLITR